MLLENKCPLKSIDELLPNKNYDLHTENDAIAINKSGRNGYFTQIQVNLYCTRRSLCKCFTWFARNGNSVCLDVQFDESFVANISPRIRTFYFKHLCVRIVDDFSQGRPVLCENYQKIYTS